MSRGEMMRITVRLFAILRINRFKEETCDYPPGTTVIQVVEDLQVPKEELALMLINGQTTSLDRELNDNDILSLFPPVEGG